MIFRNMKEIQFMAMQLLAANGYIGKDELEAENVTLLRNIPMELIKLIDDRNTEEEAIVEFICKGLATIPLRGPKGLKERTCLMEYRYDNV